MTSDLERYNRWFTHKDKEWEARCLNCGACCGAKEDPCQHLKKDISGKFLCEIYPERFGERRTLAGRTFRCVPVRDKLHQSWPGDERCGYKSL